MNDRYDVVIIGGGPAGSTCATMLAREGHRVLVLERAAFPRFHIGESITAWGLTAFRKLGVFDELNEMNYVRKKGLDFVLPGRTVGLFFDKDDEWEGPGEQPWAIQMPRAKLDTVLLENARRSGAEVLEQHAVRELLFEGERMVGVEYADVSEGARGEPRRAYARFVIDASGQAGVINRYLKDNSYPDPLLREKIAVFNHWKGDIHVTNTDEDRNFKLCVHKNQRDWAWYIPLDRDTVSLGVVLSRESVKNRDGSIEDLFYEHAADIPFIRNLVTDPGLKTIDRFRSAKDYSFRCKRYSGEGWVLVGDSAGFIDPIFSTGLQIAFGSSFLLVETLNGILKNGDDEQARLREYSDGLDRLYRANSMFVHLFYQAKMDFMNMQRPLVIWRMIEWAGLRHRLKFLWVGLRSLRHTQDQRSSWTRQVLFGKFAPGNLLAELLLNLQLNYEELHRRRERTALRSTPPQPERAVPAVAASGGLRVPVDAGTPGEAAAPDAGRWLFLHRPDSRARVRLFCLPFAGGGASAYRGWGGLPPEMEVCPVQLPGRENRADEAPATDLGVLVRTLAGVLRPYLDLPFVLFGHSMGALLAFELARALEAEGSAPVHLFVSACPAPHLPLHGAPIHRLPDRELAGRLRRLGGVPRAILRDPEWLEVLLPVLRADCQMVDTYRPAAGPPLECPVTALGGWWDPRVRGRQLRAWAEHTRGPFSVRRFPGGHFYLQRSRGSVLRAISDETGRLPDGRGALVSAYTTFS